MRRRNWWVGAVLLLAACGTESAPSGGGGSTSAGGISGTVTVFAAASLTGSFTTLGSQFEAAHPGVTVRFNFAASSALAESIAQGAPADVFASARLVRAITCSVGRPQTSASVTARRRSAIAVSRSRRR